MCTIIPGLPDKLDASPSSLSKRNTSAGVNHEADFERLDVVIVGSWNMAILNPEWVAKKVFEQPQIDVEVLVGPGQTGLRYTHRALQMVPTPERVVFSVTNRDQMQEAERLGLRLLRELPVTPVNSVGINFGFVEPDPSPDLLSLFELRDTSAVSDQGCIIEETAIIRRLKIGEDILNLRLVLTEGVVAFNFNFHADAPERDQAEAAISGKTIKFRDEATKLLKAIYKLEEDENDGDL